jgi:prepilin-type N-terminal cleavage/methylation domain-containing protein
MSSFKEENCMRINLNRCLLVKKRFAVSGQQGFTLIEVLIAVALLATIGVGCLSALMTATNATGVVEKKVDIDWLARAQMEYTKDAQYIRLTDITPSNRYAEINDLPGNPYAIPSRYDVVVTAEIPNGPLSADSDIQQITVEITRDGNSLIKVAEYKVNR